MAASRRSESLAARSAEIQAKWEDVRKYPTREFDVVVAGGGTAGVVAAIAAARNGAKTALIEGKGYAGGTVVEGGTALHSFFNLWKAFPGVEKRQVVRGIAQEIIDRLLLIGGTTGHGDVTGKIDNGAASGTATTSFTFSDFNLSPPQVPVVLSVVDKITLEVNGEIQQAK